MNGLGSTTGNPSEAALLMAGKRSTFSVLTSIVSASRHSLCLYPNSCSTRLHRCSFHIIAFVATFRQFLRTRVGIDHVPSLYWSTGHVHSCYSFFSQDTQNKTNFSNCTLNRCIDQCLLDALRRDFCRQRVRAGRADANLSSLHAVAQQVTVAPGGYQQASRRQVGQGQPANRETSCRKSDAKQWIQRRVQRTIDATNTRGAQVYYSVVHAR